MRRVTTETTTAATPTRVRVRQVLRDFGRRPEGNPFVPITGAAWVVCRAGHGRGDAASNDIDGGTPPTGSRRRVTR